MAGELKKAVQLGIALNPQAQAAIAVVEVVQKNEPPEMLRMPESSNLAAGDNEVMKQTGFITRTIEGETVTILTSVNILPMPQNIEVSYKQKWAWQEAADIDSWSGVGQEIVRGLYKVGDFITPNRYANFGKYKAKMTLNEKVKFLYEGPEARTFNFNLLFQPNNVGEQADIQAWITRVKKDSSPDYALGTQFWKYPSFMKLEWPTMEGLFKTGVVACNGITVNYTPDGLWSQHTDGKPTATKVSLSFTELDYVTKTEVDGGW